MTIREMKTVTCSSPHDALTISSCQWQSLKARRHRNEDNLEEHDRGHGIPVPRSRHKHSACCMGEYLYVFCGKDGTSPRKDVWKFHIQQQTWEAVELRGGSLPFLQGHTAVTYKRLVLIFGGTFSDSLGDVQLWTYNPDLGHLREVWIEPGAAQPLCRRDHSAVVHNNLMYIYGGFVDSAGANQELWAFNIDDEEWTELTTLSRAQPGRRYGHSAVVADNAMWLFGGMAGLSPRADLWRYSLLLYQWKKVKAAGSPPCLSGHTACVIHQQMMVVGGNCQGKPSSDIWCFRFDTNVWLQLTSSGITSLPRLSFHSCVVYCPVDRTTQQPTGRTRSTPHLKPPAVHQLHPDHFVVRPRSSPAVTKEKDGRGSSGHWSGVRETQVMTLTGEGGKEMFTVTINGDMEDSSETKGTNSCNKMDSRIHVSHREPLVSSSPEMPGFYDSCTPFSQKGQSHSRSYDDFSDRGTSVLRVPESRSAPEQLTVETTAAGDGAPKTDRNLIDLSDSPVLKTSTRGKSTDSSKQNPFRNDLFVEDLDMVDVGGLDELKISYPSKNPFLPLPLATAGEGGDLLETVLLPEQQERMWRQPLTQDQYQWQQPQYHQQQHNANSQVIELKQCVSGSESESAPCSNLTQLTSKNAHRTADANIHPDLKSGNRDFHSNNCEPHCEHHGRIYRKASVKRERQGQLQRRVDRKSLELRDSSPASSSETGHKETETSFIENTEGFMSSAKNGPFSGARPCTTVAVTSNISGNSAKNYLMVPGPGLLTRQVGERDKALDTGTGTGERCTMEEAGGCERETGEPGEPFMLVLGGRTEEQGSVHPKPMPVWKGVFL